MRYDYGEYVDREGATIPAYCMVENSEADGSTFYDAERQSYYAYWLITGEGCNPSAENNADASEGAVTELPSGYNYEDFNGQTAVKIWRTPQYNEWYQRADTGDNQQPTMTLDGKISNVAHFESACIKYQGEENPNGSIKWTETDDCKLVVDDGITITDSSNGRNASDQLVLRFSAIVVLNPEVYKFSNHHMLGIAPAGRRNVTDSYVQVQKLFSERAADCAADDIVCSNNTRNLTGGTE